MWATPGGGWGYFWFCAKGYSEDTLVLAAFKAYQALHSIRQFKILTLIGDEHSSPSVRPSLDLNFVCEDFL